MMTHISCLVLNRVNINTTIKLSQLILYLDILVYSCHHMMHARELSCYMHWIPLHFRHYSQYHNNNTNSKHSLIFIDVTVSNVELLAQLGWAWVLLCVIKINVLILQFILLLNLNWAIYKDIYILYVVRVIKIKLILCSTKIKFCWRAKISLG